MSERSGTGAESSAAETTWKKILTLEPLGPNDVPPHNELREEQTNPPQLSEFLQHALVEAQRELERPRKKIGVAKASVTNCAVVVEKWKTEKEGELLWFGRTSEHEEGKPVTFEELDGCLMKSHELHEADYTPDIYDVNTLMEWKCDDLEVPLQGIREVEMRITQMHHAMPSGILSDRFFTVLLISFVITSPPSAQTLSESINMQIPINFIPLPATINARAHIRLLPQTQKYTYHHQDADAAPVQVQKTSSAKDIVWGKYVSVERIRLVEKEGRKVIVWDMKTASDAGGNLPDWMQKMGIPGAIVKDVPLALKFIVQARKE